MATKPSEYKFELNEVEIQNLKEFQEQVPAKHKKEHTLELCFKFTGIGIGVTARIGAYSKDITDYNSW